MATLSTILARQIPQREDCGVIQFMGCKRLRHDLVTKQQQSRQQTDPSYSNDIFIKKKLTTSWYKTKNIFRRDICVPVLSHFSSVTQSCPTLCNHMNCSMPGLPVHHQLPEFTQTHVHWVGDAIQPSHPLSSPSPPAPNPFQHQSLFQWVNSSHEVAKVLEFQL